MKVSVKQIFKSIHVIQDFEIPDFVVLTGKNGSGKSHLMSAMARPENCDLFDDEGKWLSQIKYIPFNGLNPHIDENCDYMGFTNNRKQAWNNVKQYLVDYNNQRTRYRTTFDQYVSSDKRKKRTLEKLAKIVNWDAEKITEELFDEHYEISSDEMFSSQFASIFKLYQVRLIENEFNLFLNEKKGQHNKVLSDEEFEKLYGPKPWELINRMLSRAGLTYQVNHPEGSNKELDFQLHLTDVNTGTEIRVNDMSTGEKVLMALALSIYNTKEETARPDVLLLDEPDAALHPEFSKVLVSAIEESIVKEAKVKVVISTHSPMTVVLAPEDSIFLMDKNRSRPVKITKQQAVNILTKDLDNVRLSIENRRQVFVESKYDVGFYNRLYKCLSVNYVFTTVPFFLPAKSGDGSNCQDVKDIVNALRKHGNDLVYGIIDYDGQNHGNQYVCVVGGGKRYAIDNYIFDPIYVAFLLIREHVVTSENMGVGKSVTFTLLHTLTHNELQTMIDYVASSLGFNDANKMSYNVLAEPDSYEVASEWFTIQGHELEEKILQKWPKLNGVKARHGDDYLKNYVLDNVIVEFPQFIAQEIKDLFEMFV